MNNIFAGRFGRESLVIENGKYLKDLKYLNRPLNRIVVVDSSQTRLEKCYDNSIVLNEFKGGKDDNSLMELLPLLEHLSKPDVRDVRTELKKYGNENP